MSRLWRTCFGTAALAEQAGEVEAIAILADIDAFYADRSGSHDSVRTALVQRLADPAPRDPRVTAPLPAYKGLAKRWHDWRSVIEVCHRLADGLLKMVEAKEMGR
ncbi:MAG: hypothetical protein L0H25_06275 [Micrococcales bacterium]|nr:hypothetical protein [Micrococcales bacterium]